MAAAGTKRGYDRGEEKWSDFIWEKKRKCNFWEDDSDESTAMTAVGTKRGYEPDPIESDVMSEKRYKCNYWEDPKRAKDLERWGGRIAQSDALDAHNDRFLQDMREWK